MDLGIAGRAALVTGGSAGLGLASARALAIAGVRVCLVARDAERLDGAVAELPSRGHWSGVRDIIDAGEVQVVR